MLTQTCRRMRAVSGGIVVLTLLGACASGDGSPAGAGGSAGAGGADIGGGSAGVVAVGGGAGVSGVSGVGGASGGMPPVGGAGGNAMSGAAGVDAAGAGNGGSAAGSAGAGGSGGVQCGDGAAGPVARHGQLSIAGNKIQDSCGEPVTLRGQGFGWDNWWPQYYNADVVGWLRDDWCVDVVRPAMGIDPEGAYLENPDASKARIRAVVEAAIERQVYVIIDWHSHDAYQSEAISFFSEMAQAYGEYPNVLYEIFNEPDEETWPEVKAYAESVIDAIRAHDPDNIVIVGSPEWDQRIDLVAESPITSSTNLAYSVHFYAATHGDWLRERTAAALAAGIPVFITESSGSEASGLGANNYTEWEAWLDFLHQNQVSWVHYAVADKEGETISVLEPGAPSAGGWDASQLTETGEYIRDVLRSHCN